MTKEKSMEQEQVFPFRERSGKMVWPEGKKLAITMYVSLEEWGEDTVVKYKGLPPLGPGAFLGMKRPKKH